jgi:uncharacterized protein (UPF0333 family)
LRKVWKAVFIVILVALLATALTAYFAVSHFEADIHFAQSIAVYEKENDHWITRFNEDDRVNGTFTNVHGGNYGSWEGSFSLVLTFTNATFSPLTPQPYQRISDTVVKFSFTLQKDERKYADVYFTIDENAASFSLKLDFEPAQPFIRSTNVNGQTTLEYYWWPQENAFYPNTIG